METSNQQSPNLARSGWLVLLLAVVAAVAAAYVPLFLIIAPALWAYAAARTRPYWLAVPAAVFAYGMFTFEPAVVAAAYTAGALLASVLLLVLLTHGFSNSDTVLILCGVFLVMMYSVICVPGLLEGRQAYADIHARVGDVRAIYSNGAAFYAQISPDAEKTVQQMLDTMYDAVPTTFVAVLCIFASVLGLSNLLFFRAFCRKQTQIKLSPMRAFRDWTLPRSMTLGLFAILIGSIVLEFTGWAFAESFAVTANILLCIPLFLQGISVVDFMLSRAPKNVTVARTLTYIGLGVLYQWFLFPLVLVGVFDQIFHVRDRMRGIPPKAAA